MDVKKELQKIRRQVIKDMKKALLEKLDSEDEFNAWYFRNYIEELELIDKIAREVRRDAKTRKINISD